MNFKNNQLSSRFKQVFHNTGFGIMIVDKNRDLIEVNPKFCEMLGYTKEELIGQMQRFYIYQIKLIKSLVKRPSIKLEIINQLI